jgi:hypothetical protein
MRILHLSHEGLPDWRVEKAALTALKEGHDVLFAGGGKSMNYYHHHNHPESNNIFRQIFRIQWTAKARYGIPYYWYLVKKQLRSILQQAKPDIVHAHNLFSAKLISEFGEHYVYDDHEFWSKQSLLLIEMERQEKLADYHNRLLSGYDSRPSWGNILRPAMYMAVKTRRKAINRYIINLWKKWEKEIVTACPVTITVSRRIAEELQETIVSNKNKNRKVVVVPNYPTIKEARHIARPCRFSTLSSTYAGSDGHDIAKYPNRNIDGLYDLFDSYSSMGTLTVIGWKENSRYSRVKFAGFLSRSEMYDHLSSHSIGLLPWKKHWSHYFVNPNKVYEYAHAGLFVLCTSSFETVIETLKENCQIFDTYQELSSQLQYYSENMDELYKKRLNIFDFARHYLVWDNFEHEILNAYQRA